MRREKVKVFVIWNICENKNELVLLVVYANPFLLHAWARIGYAANWFCNGSR